LAPEIALGNRYDQSVDWWSFGIVVFEMLSGRLPFENKDKTLCMKDIVSKNVKMPKKFSKEATDLVTKLLIKDPKKRLGANGINEIMEHSFFKLVDWKYLEENDFTEFPRKAPKGFKDKCFGRSEKSSIISLNEESFDNRIPNFTFVDTSHMKRWTSAL
jgi:serine/threonine protein kinase